MSRTLLIWAIIIFAFLGIADTWYLAQAALTDTALQCGINTPDGCNVVAQSEYSRLMGIPLAIYGLAFYAATFALAALALLISGKTITRLILALGTVGLLSSAYFLYLQVFRIEALCIYCIASFALSVLIFCAAIMLNRHEHTAVLP